MSESPFDRKDRLTGPLVATTMVLMLGALGACIVLAAGGADPIFALVIFFGSLCLIALLLWLLRATPEVGSSIYGWVKSRHVRPSHFNYDPAPRSSGKFQYGTNAPPTANGIREMKDDLRTWVPHPDRDTQDTPRQHRKRS